MTRILVVEDYPVTQRMLALALRNHGYDVLIAGNGREALRLLDDQTADLALIDIAMPEMDGIDLLRHLRTDNRFVGLPVIMVSASGQDEDRAVCLATGANDYIVKPVRPSDLIEAVSIYVTP
ncbi:MAG: response regulator [Anaerolineae bacterium]|nr:response regulator [Anaerolineae bacterium]